MIGHELEPCAGADLLRFIRALGKHRYVASRLHLVHAFAFEAAGGDAPDPAIGEAVAWARRAVGSGAIDLGSKDERLYRRASDAEVALVLESFWDSANAPATRERLLERLGGIGALPNADADAEALPFDESREDEIFPVLLDVGWELLPLAHLDADRHRGAIEFMGDFEVARFEEESAVPSIVTLHELPLLGATELVAAFDDAGSTRAPFVLWQQGHEEYLDYVLRGVLRGAKLA